MYVDMGNGKIAHVTHLMADGRVLEDVKGYLTSANQLPETTKTLLINLMLGQARRNDKDSGRE